MNNNESLRNYLTDLQRRIQSDSIDELDFDSLAERLVDLAKKLDENERQASELAVLREDYCQRTAGMIKAIAVADRKTTGLKEAEELIESLERLGSQQLVQMYRKTQARFHDAFPSSFGLLRAKQGAVKPDQVRAFK